MNERWHDVYLGQSTFPKPIICFSDKLSLTLPRGVKDRHVKLIQKDRTVTVSASRKTRNKKTGERKIYNCLYSFTVPEGSQVEREFENGRLTLKISEQKKEQ